MSIREHRDGVRRGTSTLLRQTLRHRERKQERRSDDRSAIEKSLDEWREVADGDTIWMEEHT